MGLAQHMIEKRALKSHITYGIGSQNEVGIGGLGWWLRSCPFASVGFCCLSVFFELFHETDVLSSSGALAQISDYL